MKVPEKNNDHGSLVELKNKVVSLDVDRKPYVPKHKQKIPEYANIKSSQTKSTRLPEIHDGTCGYRAHIAESIDEEYADPLHKAKTADGERENRAHMSQHFDHDEIYRSLMEGVLDKTLLDKSPQVIEYERRNNVGRLLSRQQMPQTRVSKLHISEDTAMESDGIRFDKIKSHGVKASSIAHCQSNMRQTPVQKYDKPVCKPLPPLAPKPESDSATKHRRKYRRTTTQIEIDNQRVVHHVPRPPFTQAHHEKEANEVLRVGNKNDLHQCIKENAKTSIVCDTQVFLPVSVVASDSNIKGCSDRSHIPADAELYESAELKETRDDDIAKTSLRSRPKIKKEKKERNIDIGQMPENIRKKMKMYFR